MAFLGLLSPRSFSGSHHATSPSSACVSNCSRSLLRCCNSESVQDKKTLYLLSLLPYFNPEPSLNPSWNGGDAVVPALRLAKDQVNANPDILQDYNLELVEAQSGCQLVLTTMVSFVEETYHREEGRKITGIIGPVCSSSTIALAPVTNRSDLALVMLHGSGSPQLANRTEYLYHLGTLGSAENFVSAIEYLLHEKWKRVAVLYDESRLFYAHTKKALVRKLNNTPTTIKFLSPVSFHYLPLDVIREELIRVVIVLCPPELTRRIICLSFRKNMIYENYQWVYVAHTEDVLVRRMEFSYKGHINCTEEDMADALNNQILLVYSLQSSSKAILNPLNMTYLEYNTKYEAYRKDYNFKGDAISRNSTYNDWTSYIFDSVWAWALVLDNLTRTYPEMFEANKSKKYEYGHVVHANRIMEQFYQTRFEGVSGPISYDRSTGFTPRTVNLIQITNVGKLGNRGKLAARIHSDDNRDVDYPPIQIPDSFPSESIRANKHLARFFISVIILQFLVILSLHVMTAMNSKHLAIKATTPILLHMSYIGTYIMLLGSFVYTLYPAIPLPLELKHFFCQVFWTWTISIGFTLSLGPVVMRTWRLYRIFIHYLNPGPFITNPILIGGVLGMLTVDILVAVIWTATDRIQTRIDKKEVYQDDTDFNIVQEKAVCTSSVYPLWILLVVMYKLVLLIFVTTLAFLTRNIKNLSFTTNSLRVLVYMTAIISVLGFSLYFLLSFNPNYSSTALSVTMMSLVGVLLVCVFMPPLLPIFKNYYKQQLETFHSL